MIKMKKIIETFLGLIRNNKQFLLRTIVQKFSISLNNSLTLKLFL
jgi:hypothetical protein